jgi:hypothetical protein
VFVAVIRDLDTAHEFHDEVGPPRGSRPGIEHPGNIRVLHDGQGLALGLEAGNDRFGVHARSEHFQGDRATHRFFLLGLKDRAHSSFANFLEQPVWPDPIGGCSSAPWIEEIVRCPGSAVRDPRNLADINRGPLQELVRPMIAEERFDRLTQPAIRATGLVQERRAFRRRGYSAPP